MNFVMRRRGYALARKMCKGDKGMLEITVRNCDDKEIQYKWGSKREFVDDINSDNEIIPMLDDDLIEVNTDDDELQNWLKNTNGIIVNDLYKECDRELKNEYEMEME